MPPIVFETLPGPCSHCGEDRSKVDHKECVQAFVRASEVQEATRLVLCGNAILHGVVNRMEPSPRRRKLCDLMTELGKVTKSLDQEKWY